MHCTSVVDKAITILAFAVLMPVFASAQEQAAPDREKRTLPEEVIVTGRRSVLQLRKQMQEAEVAAYEVFNRFNDDDRFVISCERHEPTGTHLGRQVCQAQFELDATREHALAYVGYQMETQSMELAIAAQQREYKAKIRAVAESHPEFLDAIIRYTQLRARFEQAKSTSGQE